ncbi:MAG: hypothetical protein AABX00_01930 [Nanoarchaeota archaeon]
MVSVKWCLKQKNGIEFVEPNSNMSHSYMKMAEESISALQDVESSRIWTATMAYYVFYYSLYSLMLRIGIKCEIHSCSLAFMKEHLKLFYDKEDCDMIEKAFSARIDLQYYSNRPVDSKAIDEIKRYSSSFFVKTKDALARISEDNIKNIREALKKEL